MYQSLYRKYRPNNFNEVVGQQVIVKTLKNSITNNKLSHAYLFSGPRGTGKTSIAKILAKTINCENIKDAMPCEKCDSCTQINNKQSIDILEIDAASNNGVDEIRELNNKVNLVPSIGKYKVYIIDEVHMLTTGAFNALLKTLEEPPRHIIFILATTEPHKIPSTVLSRCQRFDFKKLNVIEMKSRIEYILKKEKIKMDSDAIDEIARISDGGMRDSLSLLDQVIAYASNNIKLEDVHEISGTITPKELNELVKALINRNIEQMFVMIENINLKGKDFIKLTEELILFFRNIMLCKKVPLYYKENINIEIDDEILSKIEIDLITDYLQKLNNLLLQMKNSNNPRINFELLIIELLKSKNKENIQLDNEVNEKAKSMKKNEEKKINKEVNTNSENKVFLLSEQIKILKKTRINNALNSFEKQNIKKIENEIGSLTSLYVDDKYNKYYSILIDGKLKIFGNNILIFIFNSKRLADNYNCNLFEIDEMIRENISENYKSAAIDIDEWNIIKNEYNKVYKKNGKEGVLIKYPLIKEPIIKKEKKVNGIEELFNDIIETN